MNKPGDQKQRDMIVRALDQSMLVEAGAGSGKTTSLVDRTVALIGTGKGDVRTMAAVTFTRKAAAELQGRFQMELEKAFRQAGDSETKARFESALQWLDHLFAGTIHSFCSRILRERPIEAGLDPDFAELEEYEDRFLMDRCWAEYLDGLSSAGSPLLSKLDELGLSSPGDLKATYITLCLYPEVRVMTQSMADPDFRRDKSRLNSYLDRVWKLIPHSVPEKGWDGLQTALRQAFSLRAHLDMTTDKDFIRVLSTLDKSGRITQNRWHNAKQAKDESAAFDRLKEELVSPCLKQWREYCHPFIDQNMGESSLEILPHRSMLPQQISRA